MKKTSIWNISRQFVISGFRRDVDETCALLGYQAVNTAKRSLVTQFSAEEISTRMIMRLQT